MVDLIILSLSCKLVVFIHIHMHEGRAWIDAFHSLTLWAEISCAELASDNDTEKPEFVKGKEIIEFGSRRNRR